MKNINKELAKELALLGILESERITENNPKSDDDLIVRRVGSDGVAHDYKVNLDNADEATINAFLKIEQLKSLERINGKLKFFVVLTVIVLIISFIAAVSIANMF